VFACHDRTAQVDCADAVESLLAQFVQRLVATPNADPDIVVQDIDAAPARPSGLHRGGERLFLGHVGGEGHTLATLRRHRNGLLGGGDNPVDRQDPGAFSGKAVFSAARLRNRRPSRCGRPLKRGGVDAPWNMQWQTIAEGKAKDAAE
jgi:hypothetical protein